MHFTDESCNTTKAAPKKRVKSGCRTCKARKVKCDEGKPVCQRCISTGRSCDGYGIWGGGSNQQHVLPSRCGPITVLPSTRYPTAASVKQRLYFERFVLHTVQKLPGVFPSAFWHTLVLQAGSSEEVVFNAALALCASQERPAPKSSTNQPLCDVPDEDEYFMLQHYGKAMSQLQTRLTTCGQDSVRVALITCLLFVCLEFIRGHYQSAIVHLKSGIRLLRDSDIRRAADRKGSLTRRPWDFTQYWIAEAFSRLTVSTALMGQISPHLYPLDYQVDLPTTISSANQARHCLDQLFISILHLESQACAWKQSKLSSGFKPLKDTQAQLRLDVSSIKRLIHNAQRNPSLHTLLERFAYGLLGQYLTMAEVMIGTCLHVEDQTKFDLYTPQFSWIVEESIPRFKFALAAETHALLTGFKTDQSKPICDYGAIPPLYYVALNCRVHRVRLQALKLLRLLSHSEGIWHSKILASVAGQVIRLEESDFYKSFNVSNDFSAYTLPLEMDASLPPIPDVYRVRVVQLTVPNDALGDVVVHYYKGQEESHQKSLVMGYDICSGMWKPT